uniref:DNA-dependent DNA polymerase family B n=1 Tax=Bodo saltans virus TaxID=2024608 RepID=UPI002481AA1E|nr:DNA-dependent DNA polymerase family B [Bodo saltans virus]
MATCESNNFIFQVLDWDFTHKEVDEDKRYYVIQMFGKTKDQKTVYVEFTDFKPFFYIRINPTWTNTVIQTLIEEIKKNMKKKMDEEDEDGNMKWKNVGDGLISTNVVEAEKFLGFTAGKKFKFLQLNFDDYEIMKKCEYACKRIYKLPMVKYVIKLEIFESNILPLIRFMHIRGLDAVGWVSIPIDKLISNTYQKSCCDINYRTKWNNVSKVDDVTISKFDILSFDIECTSTDGSFPQADRDGDKVIQIGATFSRFGESECYKRYLLALNETDVVEDCEVQWYEKEEELLLAFTKLLRQTNPDIITGYNICGFDFLYLHKRAEYLSKKMQPSEGNKFLRSFEKMSRINNEVCEWKEAKLSSSALGDNILKYYKMTGRVIIDLMKVAQRDYKLSSYKLDYVAANFIKENIVNLLCDNAKSKDGKCEYKLETKNTFGLQNGNFITIIYSDGTGAIDEKYNEGEKFQIYNLQQKSFCIKGNIDTSEFMGKGYKIFWSQVKDDIKARDIFKLFKQTPQDRAIIAKYCVMDCELCNKLMTKLQIITNNVGMANVCNVPLSYLFLRGQGVKIFSLVAKKCREKNFIIPVIQKKKIFENKDNDNKDKPQNQVYKKKLNDCDELDEKQLDKLVYELSNKTNKKNEEVGNDEEDEGYEGAIVFEPIAGVYLEPIPVLDFASLYPSAMILRNLSHEMFVNDPMYDNLHGYRYHTIWYKKNNGETVTCKFAEKRDGTKGIIPEILMYLLTTRKKYKKMMNDTSDPFIYSIYDGLQQAYKVTSNSLYGQTGGTHSPICLKEIAASTTATGREMLQFSKYFIENIFSKTINLALSDKEQYYKLMNETFLYHPTSYVVKDNKNEDITIHVNTDEYDKINDKKFIKNSIGYEVSYEFPNEKKIIDELKAEKKSISWENILTKMNYIDEWNKLIKWVNDVVFKLPIEQRHLIKNNLSKIGKITKKLNIVNIFDSIDVSDDVLEYFKTNLTILIDNSGYDNKQQFFDKFYCFANELLEGYSIDAKIIYGDTDSVFFCSHIKNNETGELLKNKHALYIGIRLGIWASICISTLLPAPMAQEYEKVLWPFIIQGKKRYVGNLYEKDPDHFKQKSMGIELKRRDNAPIVKTVSAGIIDQILNKLSPEGAFEFTKDILNKIIFKQFKIDKFIITKTLKGNALTKKEREEEQKKPKEQRVYVDRTRIVHAVLADRMADRDPGNRPLSNDRIPYAYIITKFEPELQGDRVETPDYIVENNLELDFLFYITNQIMKPALKFLDLITTNAHGLFKEYIIREENRKNNILPITYYSKNNIEENVDEFIKNNVNDDIIIKKIKKKTQKKKSKKIEANTNTNSIKDSKSLLDGF